MKSSISIGLVFLLVLYTGLSLNTYTHTFDNQYKNSAFYPLGQINAGNTIMIKLTTKGTSLDFSTAAPSLTDSSQIDVGAPSSTSGCGPGQNFCTMTFDIVKNGNYIYGIASSALPWQSFEIHITTYETSSGGPSNANAVITTIHKATEVFRSTTMKLIYLKKPIHVAFSLNPIPGQAGNPNTPDFNQGFLNLHPVTSIKDGKSVYNYDPGVEYFSDTKYFARKWNSNSKTLLYSTSKTYLKPGYYVLKATIPPSLPPTPLISPIVLRFNSDTYDCPFEPSFVDFHSNYQPCIKNPCLNFDKVLKQCIQCESGFFFNPNRDCKIVDGCPQGFYQLEGKCKPRLVECSTYDKNNVFCTSCKLGYVLFKGECMDIGSLPCGKRQFKEDGVCKDVSKLCVTFNSLDGGCLTCQESYKFKPNGICVKKILPANCILVTNRGVCKQCRKNYQKVFGMCIPFFKCKQNQIRTLNGNCIDKIPGCKIYHPYQPACVICIKNRPAIKGLCP